MWLKDVGKCRGRIMESLAKEIGISGSGIVSRISLESDDSPRFAWGALRRRPAFKDEISISAT